MGTFDSIYQQKIRRLEEENRQLRKLINEAGGIATSSPSSTGPRRARRYTTEPLGPGMPGIPYNPHPRKIVPIPLFPNINGPWMPPPPPRGDPWMPPPPYQTAPYSGPQALPEENRQYKIRKVLTEGPIWDQGTYDDQIADPNTAYASTDAQTPQMNPNQNTSTYSNRQLGFAASNRGNQGNQGGITPEQYTAHAYQVIMGMMQDAVDQGIIDAGSMSQLAGQAYATWVAGGPSALINFLNQNNIPFQQD